MAKAKNKTLVEKVIEGADKILHPENHEAEKSQDQKLAEDAAKAKDQELAKKSDDESDELSKQSKPKSAQKSEMGKHKKFDKFN